MTLDTRWDVPTPARQDVEYELYVVFHRGRIVSTARLLPWMLEADRLIGIRNSVSVDLHPPRLSKPRVPDAPKVSEVPSGAQTAVRCNGLDGTGRRCASSPMFGRQQCWHHTPERLVELAERRGRAKAVARASERPRCGQTMEEGRSCAAFTMTGKSTCFQHRRRAAQQHGQPAESLAPVPRPSPA